jgi:two-component system chemotaxis response regulator CheB
MFRAKHLREMNEHQTADLLLQKASAAKRRASLVRQAVMSNEILSQDNIEQEITNGEKRQDF